MTDYNIEEALKYIIVNNSTVKAITTRCYPATIPQNPEYPLVLYMKITGVRSHHLQGPSGSAHPRFQVEAWAATYAEVKALANAIREALDGYSGTVSGCKVRSILIQSERDSYESAVECHRVIQDYMIWHNE